MTIDSTPLAVLLAPMASARVLDAVAEAPIAMPVLPVVDEAALPMAIDWLALAVAAGPMAIWFTVEVVLPRPSRINVSASAATCHVGVAMAPMAESNTRSHWLVLAL